MPSGKTRARTTAPAPPLGAGPGPATSQTGLAQPLPLPHERDEATDPVAAPPDPVIVQAKKDLDAGLVDTDLRNPPGADAVRREQLLDQAVPGPGSGARAAAGSQPARPRRRSR